ncbi:MAG: hypothetical protein ABW321_34185 [Polyangiales bacterium]
MNEAWTIPILMCVSLPDTLAFYRGLGFTVTHEQTRPNVYAALQWGQLHLHFAGLAKLTPEQVYSQCLIIVPEVAALHAQLASRLREVYGKLPLKGIPRISRLRPRASRFNLVDVAGNTLTFIQRGARDDHDDYDDSVYEPTADTPLGKALHTARRLRDFRNDDRAAARVLDVALAKPAQGRPIDRARVLAARVELALVLGDPRRAQAARAELEALVLTPEERALYHDELTAADHTGRESTPT